VPSPRTCVLAAPFGSSPFDLCGAAPAVVTTTAARHRGVVPFIPSNALGMTVVFTFAALATRLPRRLF
jgi:TRAP-type mannitol/chloroaromatic compound transport system permease large subunit